MSVGSPMVARLGLATFLKQSRGCSAADAAAVAGCSKATLSRIERAETTVEPGTAKLLLEHYGVAAEAIAEMLPLAYAAKQTGWWERAQHKTAVPRWFSLFVGVESAATRIRTYEPELVPGILQTPQYSRVLIQRDVNVPETPDDIDRLVNLRQRRQETITGEVPPQLSAILNEGVLHREVGGPQVMHGQLAHLLAMSALAPVEVRILPFAAGAHAAAYGTFVVLDYSVVNTKYALAYVEYCGGAVYLETHKEVALHAAMFDNLLAQALTPEETQGRIKHALDSLT